MAGTGVHTQSYKSFMRKAGRIMLIILSVLLAGVLVLTGVLLARSPGRVDPFLDKNGVVPAGSISEKIFLNIGGVEQGMFIRGRDIKNPVLLFLHGGPGMPTYFLTKQFPTGLEDRFTVCYWEQRGAGISYSPDGKAENLTVEQLISDTIEVTNYLRKRFGQEKITLMAHSWGTFIGMQAAAKAPELYCAYVGVSQITNQLASEKIAYKWMMEQYLASGNTNKVKMLQSFPILESDASVIPYFKAPVRDAAMHELGVGTMRNMKDVYNGVFFPFLGTKEYTLAEKFNTFFRAKPFIQKETGLIDELFATNLTVKVPKLEIPVYFMSGSYDYTVNHELNRAYLTQLQAPVKGYYTFSGSAHSPMHEEPDRFMRIIVEDVLNGTTALADKN